MEGFRNDFPLLERKIRKKDLIYFDNAATTQKPLPVLEASSHYYKKINANIHRSAHYLGQQATLSYEKARESIARYLGAEKEEIIFTSGCTDSINLCASTLKSSLSEGDQILLTALEHHSNIVPWQMIAEETKTRIQIVPILENGNLDIQKLDSLLTEKVKIFSFSHVSNALGVCVPVKEFIAKAQSVGAITIVDGAQAIPHLPVNVKHLNCDFYAFSGHKVYAPTGIGVLYGKKEILKKLPPYRGGGEMIKEVTFEKTTYQEAPLKYEAGTPNIEGAIALERAIQYISDIGIKKIAQHEISLRNKAISLLKEIPGVRIYAENVESTGIVSFNIMGFHPFDIGTLLDQMGVAVRTGHHCCQPLMQRYKITGTIRISFALYNTEKEVEEFIQKLKQCLIVLKKQ